MALRTVKSERKLRRQADHVDAWLMSYADMITLLFMVFVLVISIIVSQRGGGMASLSSGERSVSEHYGSLSLATPYDAMYRDLVGTVIAANADQAFTIDKTSESVSVDIASANLFDGNTADIAPQYQPLLQSLARILKQQAKAGTLIEVQGHTDDTLPAASNFADKWELSSMRAARVASVLAGQGIDPRLLRPTGYADTKPLVPNRDIAGNPIDRNRLRNQRIVIRLSSAS